MASYPFAIIAHPIAGNSDDGRRAKAEVAVQALVPLLTWRGPTA